MSTASPGAASLIERAAAVYDFAAALRSPAADPASAKAAPAAAVVTHPRAVRTPAPAAAAMIDRQRLAALGVITPEQPTGPLAEQFRIVKRALLRGMAAAGNRRSCAITSALAGEGKSFCAINLAISLACEDGADIVLVDGDFAKPELAGKLGLAAEPGFLDAVRDQSFDVARAVIATDIKGLSVLPAGRDAPNVTELLASVRAGEVVDALLDGRPDRILLFDTAPVLGSSQPSVLAGLVGQILLVVRADETSESDLREAIGLLSACPNIATLLNASALSTDRNYGPPSGDDR